LRSAARQRAVQPGLPMAALFMADDLIALFSFGRSDQRMGVHDEKHYQLVPPDQMALED
jgi:hypothetical protein